VTAAEPLDPRALESLLAFWRDAGVLEAVDDLPHDRLAEGLQRQQRAHAPAPDEPAPLALPSAGPAAAAGAALAREAALACDSLEALAEAAAEFGRAQLKTRRPPVFSRGPAAAALMVVGDQPGADEETEGRPFAGRAGALLDRALAAAGLLDGALLTYTIFWRPPGDRAPTPEQQAVLEPFLDRAVAIVQPRALLVLGQGAAPGVLRQDGGVGGLRGRWLERVGDDGALRTPALASFSPAFLLAQPRMKKAFWADLLTLAARLETPEGG
jgi:DNA polymerase